MRMRALLLPALIAVAGLSLAACKSTPEEGAITAMKAALTAAQANDLDGAERAALRAAELRPGFVDPLMLLAAIAEKRGDQEAARVQYFAVLKADPTDTAAGVAVGMTYVRERQFDAARIWFLKAIDSDPGCEPAAYNLGSVAAQEADPESAVAWFEIAAALDRHDPRAMARIAELRLAQGRPEAALEAADEALRRYPQSQSAQAVRTQALRALGRN